jgi:hypothetical protein
MTRKADFNAEEWSTVASGPHWLLAYEGSVRKWLSSPAPRVAKHPFFKVLKARGAHFYDQDPMRSPLTGPAGPLPGGLVPDECL